MEIHVHAVFILLFYSFFMLFAIWESTVENLQKDNKIVENFIPKAIARHISSKIGRKITAEKTCKPRPVLEEIQ